VHLQVCVIFFVVVISSHSHNPQHKPLDNDNAEETSCLLSKAFRFCLEFVVHLQVCVIFFVVVISSHSHNPQHKPVDNGNAVETSCFLPISVSILFGVCSAK